MIKFLIFGGIACVGIIVAIAFYAAWKITKMGKDLRNGVGASGGQSHNDYITTTGTTLSDESNRHSSSDDSSTSQLGYSSGESAGSDVGSGATDFSSSDSGSFDSGSSDSGSSSSD